MGKIVVLPDTLCNQIAAGEVVERPAAVVKELMENSLDAQSRKITVSLLQGGRKEIRVVDNGIGMGQDDALLALERHATSKIKTLEDLQAIRSLGFRGEALPSIASVSRFELVTREAQAISGVRIYVEGGIIRDVRETGCPAGTMVMVRDLFYNLPARRKFLRTPDTEMAHIGDQFLRLAMAHPEIHFQLAHQERLQYEFTSVGNSLQRAAQVLGGALANALRPFALEGSTGRLHGLCSPPDVHRASGHALFTYINGRPVWDRLLNRAILGAYETLLPKGKFPVVILFVEMRPDLVDVNVHPTKREVRFREPGELLDRVRKAIRGVLTSPKADKAWSLTASLPGSSLSPTPTAPHRHFTRETQLAMATPVVEPPEAAAVCNARRAEIPISSPPPALRPEPFNSVESAESEQGLYFSRLPFIGQLANAYLLLEAPQGLVLIDQHAAHERILYDRLTDSSPQEPGQRLLCSMVLDLFPKDAAKLRRWLEPLAKVGFEVEPFGSDSFIIHAVPALLGDYPPDTLLRDVVEMAHEEEQDPRWSVVGALARSASCHGAVRAGQKLHPEEVRHLLEALDRTRAGATCPHGRPVYVKLTLQQIAHLFHRT